MNIAEIKDEEVRDLIMNIKAASNKVTKRLKSKWKMNLAVLLHTDQNLILNLH